MKRRSFLNRCLVTSGGVIIGKNILYAEAIKEINHQFSNEIDFESFDVIINGAGLAGYYAALEASKKGMKVLVLDKRTSPGYDIAGKRKLWLNSSGVEHFQKEHFELFFPDGEKSEIASSYENPSFPSSNSITEDEELLLFAGSIKKGMMRNLLINKVQVLLMTDVCGIISDDSSIKGVLVACKHGLFTIKCKSFIDATDNNLFTRDFFNQNYKIEKAGFVIELIDVKNPIRGELPVDISLGTLNNKIKLHKGKKTADQQFIDFEFPGGNNNIGEIEQQARFISANISKHIPTIDEKFSAPAKLYNYALECSYFIDNSELPDINLSGFYCLKNSSKETLSCKNILDIESTSKSLIE